MRAVVVERPMGGLSIVQGVFFSFFFLPTLEAWGSPSEMTQVSVDAWYVRYI